MVDESIALQHSPCGKAAPFVLAKAKGGPMVARDASTHLALFEKLFRCHTSKERRSETPARDTGMLLYDRDDIDTKARPSFNAT